MRWINYLAVYAMVVIAISMTLHIRLQLKDLKVKNLILKCEALVDKEMIERKQREVDLK